VCCRCSYLEGLLNFGDGDVHEIDSPVTAEVYGFMLSHLYSDGFDFPKTAATMRSLFALSHMYMIKRLRMYSESWIRQDISDANASDYLIWAHVERFESLESYMISKMKGSEERLRRKSPCFYESLVRYPELMLRLLDSPHL
jgi:hypothetical protein